MSAGTQVRAASSGRKPSSRFSSVGLAFKIRTVLPDIRAAFARGDVPDIFLSSIGTSESEFDSPSAV